MAEIASAPALLCTQGRCAHILQTPKHALFRLEAAARFSSLVTGFVSTVTHQQAILTYAV